MQPHQGVKYDQGKARFDLVPSGPLEAVVQVYTYGASLYQDRNWEQGIAWGRVFAALQRHLWAWWGGEEVDKESGLSHLAHAAWGCLALLEYLQTHPELDNRPKRGGGLQQPDTKEATHAERDATL